MLIRHMVKDGLDNHAIRKILSQFFLTINAQRILVIVPDSSRNKSFAPEILLACHEILQSRLKKILIALGTHRPMTGLQISSFYKSVPLPLFINHDWKNDVSTLGTIKKDDVFRITDSPWAQDFPVQVNTELLGDYDLILSIGQVLPHEVAGMANHSKNILIGTGGASVIGISHFIGAVCGMEKIMGKTDNPVRRLFNLGMKTFASCLPVSYIQTVCTVGQNDQPVLQGLFAGDEYSVFEEACALSASVNITNIERPASLVVARTEESSFWLGNKAIYRSRMMIADGGTLVVIAPGLKSCAEDSGLEHVILQLGYRGTDTVLRTVDDKLESPVELAGKAHLIHGSSEGRFNVIYAVPAQMMPLVESVGYQAMEVGQAQRLYGGFNREGWATSLEGREYYHLPYPAAGLWKAQRSSS